MDQLRRRKPESSGDLPRQMTCCHVLRQTVSVTMEVHCTNINKHWRNLIGSLLERSCNRKTSQPSSVFNTDIYSRKPLRRIALLIFWGNCSFGTPVLLCFLHMASLDYKISSGHRIRQYRHTTRPSLPVHAHKIHLVTTELGHGNLPRQSRRATKIVRIAGGIEKVA